MVLTKTGYADMAGWHDDDHLAAFRAFLRSASAGKLPKTRCAQIRGSDFAVPFEAALALGGGIRPEDARAFFEHHFQPHNIDASGFVTGYFEPEVTASATRSREFHVPVHAVPPELTEVDDETRPAGLDPVFRFAACHGGRLLPFADRRAIDNGYLDGRGLELAWLADPVDAFFIHIQGSARLSMTDGTTRRIAFAGKTGHAYTSIGKRAIALGYLAEDAADKAGLEAWLRANPIAGRELMHENRSYIFFRNCPELPADDGPLGAAGVPLTPLRSLAVDRTLMTFHTPVWIDVPALSEPFGQLPQPAPGPHRPLRRLMIAQDTGSAITGPARGDIFFGSGGEAGDLAGPVRHTASMVALVPKSGEQGDGFAAQGME